MSKDKQADAENLARFKEANTDKEAVKKLIERLRAVREADTAVPERLAREFVKFVEAFNNTKLLRFGDYLLIRDDKKTTAFKLQSSIAVVQGVKDPKIKRVLNVEFARAASLKECHDLLSRGWLIDHTYNVDGMSRYENYTIRFVREKPNFAPDIYPLSSTEANHTYYYYFEPVMPEMDRLFFEKEEAWRVPNGCGNKAMDRVLEAIKKGYDDWYIDRDR